MSKVRVYEAAKQLNVDPKAAVALFQAIGIHDVRNHMSSVEPEAIERVKRHLEKQKTHDVVEEKVRFGVVKRRAVAKPPSAEPSVRELIPAAPPSVPQVVEAPEPPPSAARVEQNGSAHLIPVAAKSKPRDRKSGRLPDAPASVPDVVVEAKVAIPAERPSARTLKQPAPSTRTLKQPAPSTREIEPVVAEPEPEPVAVEVAPPEPEPSFTPPTPPPPPPPVPVPVVVVAPERPPTPKSTAPKTGVEYWGGRPGVPMPTPASAQRTAIGGGATGAMPRRVQFDPRAGSSVRPGMRPGQMGGGRPMPGRGGAGMRRGPGGMPITRPKPAVSTQEMSAHKKVIRIEENITLSAMAAKLSLKATELLMKLLGMGMTGVHINTALDADTAKILAGEFGWEVEDVAMSEEQSIAEARGEEDAAPVVVGADVVVDPDLVTRPPVVTVMGHVDHGKTSLLDKIRKANVASGEAGGITQHIGAYKVATPKHGMVVFLDTPGHEAFTQMRARGASVTDIVVLVVAADDGVMPQTKEAVNHAKAAKVPIIVAVNKIDKPSAEPERVRRELVELGLQPEEWGGDTMYVNVSAQTGDGIPQLLEAIALQSEVMDLKANPKKPASGTVLEALLDRGRGPVARVLVQDGTLKVGDFILAGPGFGKVRAMTNEHGKQIHEAPPATPVEILGLSEVPNAGDPMHAVKDPKKAQEIAESRKGKMAKSLIPATAKVSLEELSRRISDSDQQELRVVIKGDVQGSVEALADAFAKQSTEKVRLSIIHAGVGAITEGDINLATAAKAIVVGFNVRPAGKAAALAEESKIEIRLYSIIYNALDDVRNAMEGLLPATLVERLQGKAEVRQVFKIKNQVVAGSYIIEGVFKRAGQVRVMRAGNLLHTGKVSALKRFKDDVKDVAEGFECGISLDGFSDLKELDVLECIEIEHVKQRL